MRPPRFGRRSICSTCRGRQSRGHSPLDLPSERLTTAAGGEVDEDRDDEQHDTEGDQRCRGSCPSSPRTRSRSPTASNSPGEKSFSVICGFEPMTSATAIVSPIARPRPSVTAPTMPPLLCANTDAADHLPPGGAEGERGFLLAAGRRVEHLAGERGDDRHDHDRQDHPGGEERPAVHRLREQPADDRDRRQDVAHVRVEVRDRRREHEDAPQAEDDRRHDRQQVHHVDDRRLEPRRARPRS